MFPIPFNFPFRKKDGTITTMDDAISSGGGGEPYVLPTASAITKGGIKIGNRLTMNGEVLSADAQIPTYTESDNGKVLTVNDSGELEWDTKGSGGGDYMLSFDFTKYGNVTRDNVVYSSAGATFNNTSGFMVLLGVVESTSTTINDITIYTDVASLALTSGTHRRFIMGTPQEGLIYRDSGKWAFYRGSWEDSEITDGNYFNDSKVKIYVDNNNKWHIYKNNVLVFEPAGALALDSKLMIGSASNSINNGIITGVRIYSGNYTET